MHNILLSGKSAPWDRPSGSICYFWHVVCFDDPQVAFAMPSPFSSHLSVLWMTIGPIDLYIFREYAGKLDPRFDQVCGTCEDEADLSVLG